jgi:hypothetical protein
MLSGATKAVLLVREQQVRDRQPACADGGRHRFGLCLRHDPVLVALEQDQRARQALGVMDRRAGAVERLRLRVGPTRLSR